MSFKAKPPLGTLVNPYHSIGKHCIGSWLLNEKGGNIIFDSSGHGQIGTFNTPALFDWSTNDLGRSLYSTANTSNVVVAAKQKLLDAPIGHNFTVVFSAKMSAYTALRAALAWGGTDDLIIYPYDTNVGNGTRVYWRDAGGNQIDINAGAPSAGEYHQFTYLSKAGNDHRLYIDGRWVITSAVSGGVAGPFNSFTLHGWADGTQGFVGNLEYAYVFDRVLTPYEIASLHTNPYQMFEPVIPLSLMGYEAAASSRILTANININFNCNITISAGRAQ